MLFDCHAHVWWDSFSEDFDAVLERAKMAGVEKIIAPGTDLETSRRAVVLAKKHPKTIYAAAGIHPEEIPSLQDSPGLADARLNISASSRDLLSRRILELRQLITNNREHIVAVGEIGTDKNNGQLKNSIKEQMHLFREQCLLALEYDLPIIVHTRESLPETLEVLDTLPAMPPGQFHCFSYDETGLSEILGRGFYVSFCGNISWSKRLQSILPTVPVERLLLETDSPLMMPRDKKGDPIDLSLRNEPANVRILAQIIADLRGVSLQDIGAITTENAQRLFHL